MVIPWFTQCKGNILENLVLSCASQYTVLWSNGSQTHPRRGRGKPIIMESVCLRL